MQENEKFEKEDAKLAEEMQAWLPEEKHAAGCKYNQFSQK